MHFFYKPGSQSQDINLLVHSLYGKLSFYLNIWKFEEKIPKEAWPFESNPNIVGLSESDYESGSHNSIHRSIKASALEYCWPNCLLLISVAHLDDNDDKLLYESLKNSEDIDISYDDQFHIMCS